DHVHHRGNMVAHHAGWVVAEAGWLAPGRAVVGRGRVHDVQAVGVVVAVVGPGGVQAIGVGWVGGRRNNREEAPLVAAPRGRIGLVGDGDVDGLAPRDPTVGGLDDFDGARAG